VKGSEKQKIIQFSHQSFWSGEPDLKKLNEKVDELNHDGRKGVSFSPSVGFGGRVYSTALFIEQSE
jgi:hypothetical protein